MFGLSLLVLVSRISRFLLVLALFAGRLWTGFFPLGAVTLKALGLFGWPRSSLVISLPSVWLMLVLVCHDATARFGIDVRTCVSETEDESLKILGLVTRYSDVSG